MWLQNNIMYMFRNKEIPSMSHRQVVELVESAGLEVVETKGLGIIPKAVHIIFRPRFWKWIDRILAKSKLLQKIGSDVIYVCRSQKQG